MLRGRAVVPQRPVAVAHFGDERFDLPGEANHAGTTGLADRRDPMLAFSSAVLAARVAGHRLARRARCRGRRVRAVVADVAEVVEAHGGTPHRGVVDAADREDCLAGVAALATVVGDLAS